MNRKFFNSIQIAENPAQPKCSGLGAKKLSALRKLQREKYGLPESANRSRLYRAKVALQKIARGLITSQATIAAIRRDYAAEFKQLGVA